MSRRVIGGGLLVGPDMDVFSRTFLPAAAASGVAIPTMSRHMPVLRRCVERGDVTVLVTRCTRPDRPAQGGCLLLLTEHRLVVTQETRVMHRLRLHLNAELRHLSNVTWNPDPKLSSLELAATAIDGIRERFLIRAHHPKQVRHLDALLSHAFRTKMPTRQVRYSPGAAAVPGSLGDSAGRPFGPAIAI